jgi:PhnB protein
VKPQPIPEGFRTVTSYFTVQDVPGLIEFLKQAFEAVEVRRSVMPDGSVMNAELRIGDSMVMLGEAPKDRTGLKIMTSMLYMYVVDSDSVYERAVKAGGKTIREPADQIYGDRVGAIEDPWGNQWWIATRKENVSDEELSIRMAQFKKN